VAVSGYVDRPVVGLSLQGRDRNSSPSRNELWRAPWTWPPKAACEKGWPRRNGAGANGVWRGSRQMASAVPTGSTAGDVGKAVVTK